MFEIHLIFLHFRSRNLLLSFLRKQLNQQLNLADAESIKSILLVDKESG